MPATARRRTYGIVAASVAAHAVLLGLVAVQTPRLSVPTPPSGPPEAIIPVLIMPRVPAPAATPGARPSPIRLHRRPQRFNLDELPLAPLVTPQVVEERPRSLPSTGPVRATPSPAADALAENARRALRGRLDCNSPSLTRAEREACRERFARGARDAPFLGLGLDRDKAGDLAAAAARKEQDFNYRRTTTGGVGTSGSGRNAGTIERPGAPNMGMGSSADDLGRTSGGDSRGATKVPF
jgi:hypothetical protein